MKYLTRDLRLKSLEVSGNITITGDLAVNGGDLTSSATTFNLLNATVTTLNVGSASTATRIGAATGAIGLNAAAAPNAGMVLGGTFTHTGAGTTLSSFLLNASLVAKTGDTILSKMVFSGGSITSQNLSETIGVVSTFYMSEPVITAGTDTVTVASTLYIANAPTEGATNAALYVASGATYLQAVNVASTLTLTGTAANLALGSNFISNGGTDAGLSLDSSNNATLSANLVATGAFGCNTKAAQTAYASGGALNAYATGAFGLNSDANMSALHAMVVSIRAALVANGIMS